MKLSESQCKAICICIQSVVTALLLLAQSLFTGCVSADNGSSVNVDKTVEINIPVNVPFDGGLYVGDD